MAGIANERHINVTIRCSAMRDDCEIRRWTLNDDKVMRERCQSTCIKEEMNSATFSHIFYRHD